MSKIFDLLKKIRNDIDELESDSENAREDLANPTTFDKYVKDLERLSKILNEIKEEAKREKKNVNGPTNSC